MWITFAIALLAAWIGLVVQSRPGAAFLSFTLTTLVHLGLRMIPKMLMAYPLGRRLFHLVEFLGRDGATSLISMLIAAAAGYLIACLLRGTSEDRKRTNWDPDRPRRRRKRRHDRPVAPLGAQG